MNWLKYRSLYFVISLTFIVTGLYSIIRYGFKFSIDFTGGSVIEYQLSEINQDEFTSIVSNQISEPEIEFQDSGVRIKTIPIDQNQKNQLTLTLQSQYPDIQELSFTFVGPSIGGQTLKKTLIAATIATISILFYVSYAFKNIKFGFFAILAMLHDTLILLGSFSLLGHLRGFEIDLLFVTALLTTLSFSVHDTIVVFDRLRELSKHHLHSPIDQIANAAISQTLVRSLNNSFTIIFMLLALVLLGGQSIQNFSIALLIGAITGTYSSTFNAIPLLVSWEQKKFF